MIAAGLIKSSRIAFRVIVYNFSVMSLILAPLVVISGLVWSWGLMRGCKAGGGFYDGR